MGMTVERFRQEATDRRRGRARGAAPYSAEQKAFAVAWSRKAVADGRSMRDVSQELGISEMTLRAWTTATRPASTGSTLRRVVVRSAPVATAPSGIVVVTAAGHRVLGLDVASAAALLRQLG